MYVLTHYCVRNKPQYYELLRRVTERREWEPWILYMLEAVEVTAHMTRHMPVEVRAVMIDAAHLARGGMQKGLQQGVG